MVLRSSSQNVNGNCESLERIRVRKSSTTTLVKWNFFSYIKSVFGLVLENVNRKMIHLETLLLKQRFATSTKSSKIMLPERHLHWIHLVEVNASQDFGTKRNLMGPQFY